jgi:hypothetical protein
MGIDAPFQLFNDEDIEKAPTLDGVYGLYDGPETIYIGKGEGIEGIRGRLKAHKAGHEGECTKEAMYFNYEIHHNPSQREAELIHEYQRIWGRSPRCNDVTPDWTPRIY